MGCGRINACFRKWVTFTTVSFGLNLASLISCSVTIVYFAIQMASLSDYNYIYQYQHQTCLPITGKVLQLPCLSAIDGGFKFKWIAYFTLDSGINLVENPFAVRNSRFLALQDLEHLILNVSYDCMCRIPPVFPFHKRNRSNIIDPCMLWSECILDNEFISYIQKDTTRYYRTYISFIIASMVSIFLSIAAFPISCQALRQLRKEQYVELQ